MEVRDFDVISRPLTDLLDIETKNSEMMDKEIGCIRSYLNHIKDLNKIHCDIMSNSFNEHLSKEIDDMNCKLKMLIERYNTTVEAIKTIEYVLKTKKLIHSGNINVTLKHEKINVRIARLEKDAIVLRDLKTKEETSISITGLYDLRLSKYLKKFIKDDGLRKYYVNLICQYIYERVDKENLTDSEVEEDVPIGDNETFSL